MPNLQPPPFTVEFFTKQGAISQAWRDFLLNQATAIQTGAAPSDAAYLVAKSNSELTAEINLGALSSGFLSIVVALGIATVSSSPTIDAAVLIGTLPALDAEFLVSLNASQLSLGTVPDGRFPATLPAVSGANLTTLNASNLASGTVPDARFPATLPALSGVNLTSLTGANVNHVVVTKTHADTGFVALNDETVLVDATAGIVTIKLPSTLVSGKLITVKKIDSSANAVTVDGNGANIDGASTQSLGSQWNSLTMQTDGSAWYIVAKV